MTLNYNYADGRIEISQEPPEAKPVVLEFQPVIVSGGQQVSSPPPPLDATVKITIDPEKLKS